jgi:hypothetical protein
MTSDVRTLQKMVEIAVFNRMRDKGMNHNACIVNMPLELERLERTVTEGLERERIEKAAKETEGDKRKVSGN